MNLPLLIVARSFVAAWKERDETALRRLFSTTMKSDVSLSAQGYYLPNTN